MPKINNLNSVISAGKSVVGQVSGALEDVAGAAGKGGFSVSAGPNGVSISANFNQLLQNKVQGNRIVSPIKDLYVDGKTRSNLFYPEDLDNEHYMTFRVMRRERERVLATTKKYEVQSITLPIPSNLQVSQGASYADTELGIFGAAAAGRINSNDVSDATSALGDVAKDIGDRVSNMFKTKDTDAAVQAAGVAAPAVATAAASSVAGPIGGLLALGGSTGSVVSGVSVSTGLAMNPHLAVVFQGVSFRSHGFSYKFMARNQQESDVIKDIINSFKYAMLPSYTAGSLAFQYPDEFEIQFAKGIGEYLYDIGTCVLESVNVNYNGEGIPLFYENAGAPVSIELQLQFKETQIHTKERLEDRMKF